MKSLNVLVVTATFDKSIPRPSDDILRKVASVSPGINVKEISIMRSEPYQECSTTGEEVDALLAEAEVLYGFVPPKNLLARAPRLKWIQAMSAGVDRLAGTDIWQSPVTITGVSGIHATPIGEFVLQLMLMFAKKAPQYLQMQQKREWKRLTPSVLRSRTVGIVGLGSIGREVARLSRAFGMRVVATRRSVRKARRSGYADLLLPSGQLKQLLSESDYVVIATPLTPETTGLIGEAELRAMKPTACLINIARGGIVDEEALIRALKEKWIAGAGLDVTAREPLPADSPLWELDNVILSPHISGGIEDYAMQATELFCDNLRRYLAGRKLRNVINKKKGY